MQVMLAGCPCCQTLQAIPCLHFPCYNEYISQITCSKVWVVQHNNLHHVREYLTLSPLSFSGAAVKRRESPNLHNQPNSSIIEAAHRSHKIWCFKCSFVLQSARAKKLMQWKGLFHSHMQPCRLCQRYVVLNGLRIKTVCRLSDFAPQQKAMDAETVASQMLHLRSLYFTDVKNYF